MKRKTTWVVLADHQNVRVLLYDAPARRLDPVEGWAREEHLKAGHDIVTDRPGRSFESAGSARSAIEPKSDPRRQDAIRFLTDLAHRLGKAATAKAFDRLVLIAPPRALGELRDLLSEPVREKVVDELNEDLIKHTVESLLTHLDKCKAA